MAVPDRRAVAGCAGAVRELNTIYKNFDRWSEQGVWARVLQKTETLAQRSGDLDWIESIDSTIVRVHQHGATLPRATAGTVELQEVRG